MFRWEPTGDFNPDELAAAGLTAEFASKEEAEDWLGLFFGDLSELGVIAVSLYEANQLIYGPMPLDG